MVNRHMVSELWYLILLSYMRLSLRATGLIYGGSALEEGSNQWPIPRPLGGSKKVDPP